MGTRPRAALAAGATALAVLLAACSGTATSAPAPSERAAGRSDQLSVSLVQYRRDQARRLVQVKLANAGDTPLEVTLRDVDLPGFAPSDPIDRTTVLRGGLRVDLPAPLGAPRCDAEATGPATARLLVAGPAGDAVRTTLPIDDGGLLQRLHAFDCAVQRARAAVDVRLRPSWSVRGPDDAPTARGTAVTTLRDPTVGVEITAVSGNLLFALPPETVEPAPPVRLTEARDEAALTFELVPARCDGHAIAEARRLTTIGVVVSVDGDAPVTLRRAPDDAGFRTLLAALEQRCAAAP